MNVQYKGRQTVNSFGDKLARPLEPAAIISFTEEEEDKVVAMGDVNCLRCKYRHTDNGNCTAVGGFCTAVPAAHCPLLRQYLDTGMTPEAFQSFVVFLQDLIGNQKASEALDRFRQLVKADKDGRLVVRPCKMGDTLFRVFAGEILEHKVRNMRYLAIQERWDIDTTPFCPYVESSIGKTIFLTHEEAERALMER